MSYSRREFMKIGGLSVAAFGITNSLFAHENKSVQELQNMVTGVNTKLSNSASERQKLEQCPTRTPEHRLSLPQARDFLEFLRHNDGED